MSADLLDFQRRFKDAILRNSAAQDQIHAATVADSAERLGIYAFAYRSRLRDALAHNFPMLTTYLGDIAFGYVAEEYNAEHPSAFASVRHVGSGLAQWLAQRRSQAPWLAEFAQLEWAVGIAFDSEDEPLLATDALAAIQPSDWPRIGFRFACGVQRLVLRTNAVELYGAATRSADAPEPRVTEPTDWLVWRDGLVAHYRSMTAIEASAFDALANGKTFGAACETLLELCDEDDVPLQAAACLKRWIQDQLIITFAIAAP